MSLKNEFNAFKQKKNEFNAFKHPFKKKLQVKINTYPI